MKNLFRYFLLLSLGTFFLTSCQQRKELPPLSKPLVIGIALGGGGFRGLAHIGVLQSLQEHHIPIKVITGTSAGAVVGALYAAGLSPNEITQLAHKNLPGKLVDYDHPFSGSYLNSFPLQRIVNKAVFGKKIEDFPIQFAAIALNKKTGQAQIFNQGDVGQAVRASASLPPLFPPTLIKGSLYLDGGLVSPVPVKAAKKLGATLVIAVDVSSPPKVPKGANVWQYMENNWGQVNQKALNNELKGAHFIIRPQLGTIGVFSGFLQADQAIQAGKEATEAVIPQLKDALSHPQRINKLPYGQVRF